MKFCEICDDTAIYCEGHRLPMKRCTNFCPPEFTGRWIDWHRGHGCDKDDGKPRTPEGEHEIAGIMGTR